VELISKKKIENTINVENSDTKKVKICYIEILLLSLPHAVLQGLTVMENLEKFWNFKMCFFQAWKSY